MASGVESYSTPSMEECSGLSYTDKLAGWNNAGGHVIIRMYEKYENQWETLLQNALKYDEACAEIRDTEALSKMNLEDKAVMMSQVALKGAELASGIASMASLVALNGKCFKTLGEINDGKPVLEECNTEDEPSFRKPVDEAFVQGKDNVTLSVVDKLELWDGWVHTILVNLIHAGIFAHGFFGLYGKEEEHDGNTTVTIDVFVGARDKSQENDYIYCAGKATHGNDILAKAESSMRAYWTMVSYEFDQLCKKEIVDGVLAKFLYQKNTAESVNFPGTSSDSKKQE